MKLGTKSILFGYHAFWLHPFFVAYAWWKLFGFPFDPRLWVAFFVHDLGYWGLPNMDGPEGETHPEWGAEILHKLVGRWPCPKLIGHNSWYEFSIFHSRSYARRDNAEFSKLCLADKLAGCLYPNWLAIGLTTLSGEIHEYMSRFKRANKTAWANEHRVETLKWISLEKQLGQYR